MPADDDELRAIVDPPSGCPPLSTGDDPISAAERAAIADWPTVHERLRLDRAAASENLAIKRAKNIEGGQE